ncbi:hypothetical protein D9M71_371540 [compost metagenome]
MAVVDHVQLGVGNAPGQQAHVDQRDDRVVVAGQHQGRLADLVQPVEAGPAEAGEQLPVVAELAAGAHLAGEGQGQLRVAAEAAAVDVRGDARAVGRLDVAPRAGHAHEHLRLARQHHRAGGSGGEDQLLAALRIVVGELLGQRAAPGHADGGDLAVVQVVEHARHQLGQAGEAVGRAGGRRAADPGYVEGDHFEVRVQRGDEGEHQLQVGADAVEDQQRAHVRLARADRGADALPVEVDGAEDERLRGDAGFHRGRLAIGSFSCARRGRAGSAVVRCRPCAIVGHAGFAGHFCLHRSCT